MKGSSDSATSVLFLASARGRKASAANAEPETTREAPSATCAGQKKSRAKNDAASAHAERKSEPERYSCASTLPAPATQSARERDFADASAKSTLPKDSLQTARRAFSAKSAIGIPPPYSPGACPNRAFCIFPNDFPFPLAPEFDCRNFSEREASLIISFWPIPVPSDIFPRRSASASRENALPSYAAIGLSTSLRFPTAISVTLRASPILLAFGS